MWRLCANPKNDDGYEDRDLYGPDVTVNTLRCEDEEKSKIDVGFEDGAHLLAVYGFGMRQGASTPWTAAMATEQKHAAPRVCFVFAIFAVRPCGQAFSRPRTAAPAMGARLFCFRRVLGGATNKLENSRGSFSFAQLRQQLTHSPIHPLTTYSHGRGLEAATRENKKGHRGRLLFLLRAPVGSSLTHTARAV